MFTIIPYTPDLAPAVADAYNALIRPVPHCHPADAEAVHAALAAAGDEWRHAALFYSDLGYRVVDWTYGYERRLD
jgi:hypothetical protein